MWPDGGGTAGNVETHYARRRLMLRQVRSSNNAFLSLHAMSDAVTGQQKESHPEGWTSRMKELIAGLCQHWCDDSPIWVPVNGTLVTCLP